MTCSSSLTKKKKKKSVKQFFYLGKWSFKIQEGKNRYTGLHQNHNDIYVCIVVLKAKERLFKKIASQCSTMLIVGLPMWDCKCHQCPPKQAQRQSPCLLKTQDIVHAAIFQGKPCIHSLNHVCPLLNFLRIWTKITSHFIQGSTYDSGQAHYYNKQLPRGSMF